MIDHLGLAVSNLHRSRRFYEDALHPLGITMLMEVTPEQKGSPGTALGFGSDGKPCFWIGDEGAVGAGTHIAFSAPSRAAVDAFHAAALAAGGRDNGKPGLRPWYHENYYGAFIHDPDGINLEAVCHASE